MNYDEKDESEATFPFYCGCSTVLILPWQKNVFKTVNQAKGAQHRTCQNSFNFLDRYNPMDFHITAPHICLKGTFHLFTLNLEYKLEYV